MQLMNNSIPKGLVPLEEILDRNDVSKNPKISPDNDEVKDYNIGSKDDPKVIKLSKAFVRIFRHLGVS